MRCDWKSFIFLDQCVQELANCSALTHLRLIRHAAMLLQKKRTCDFRAFQFCMSVQICVMFRLTFFGIEPTPYLSFLPERTNEVRSYPIHKVDIGEAPFRMHFEVVHLTSINKYQQRGHRISMKVNPKRCARGVQPMRPTYNIYKASNSWTHGPRLHCQAKQVTAENRL